MKFLCNTEFVHGVRMYRPGEAYNLTEEQAEELVALDKKKPLGALSYFTPAGEETVNSLKTVKRNPAASAAGKRGADIPPTA